MAKEIYYEDGTSYVEGDDGVIIGALSDKKEIPFGQWKKLQDAVESTVDVSPEDGEFFSKEQIEEIASKLGLVNATGRTVTTPKIVVK